MELEWHGDRVVRASIDRLWASLLDPDTIARAAGSTHGAKTLDGRRYAVTVGLGIAFFKLPVTMEVEMFDLEPPARGKMRMRGTGPGSGLEGQSTIELTPVDQMSTKLHWTAATTVHGRLAEFGAHLLEPLIRRTIESFWDDLAMEAMR